MTKAGEGGEIGADRAAELYAELRDIARHLLPEGGRGGHTLQPTAVVHEAWLRLAEGPQRDFPNRAAFLAYAARVMRNLLVDHARQVRSVRRGSGDRGSGAAAVLQLVVSEERLDPVDLLDLEDALQRLTDRDADLGRLVEMRFFAGMTLEEMAEASDRTVRQLRRSWELARAWLLRELRDHDPAGPC